MTQATENQYAEIVGYTGRNECIEIRLCKSPDQVWDYNTDYGVGLGLGEVGYWVGTEVQHECVGRNKSSVEAEYEDYLGTSVRWIA